MAKIPSELLEATLESLLFVAPAPVTLEQLSSATDTSQPDVKTALSVLSRSLSVRGIRLAELRGTYQLVSSPQSAGAVKLFLKQESGSELSKAALETLAIVAYRGPITKSDIETVRGVASDTMLRNLLARGLITEAGKSSEPGRPLLFAVSHGFLRHFGLTSTGELPPLPEGENAH